MLKKSNREIPELTIIQAYKYDFFGVNNES